MNEYVITALTILASIGIGFFLLIAFGVSWVGYFVVGVISLSILGSYAYTWWKTQSDSTVDKLKTEILIKMKKELLDMSGVIAQAEGLVEMTSSKHDLDLIRYNLVDLKFYDKEFKLDQGVEKYTLTFVEQESRRVEQKLRTLGALAAGNYRPRLDEYTGELRSQLERLLDAGYDVKENLEAFNTTSAQSSKSLREMIGKKDRLDDTMLEALNGCVGEATRLATTSKDFGDTENVEKDISKVDERDFEASVSRLVAARKEIKGILNDAFLSQHSKLILNVKKVQKTMKSENIGEGQKGTIEEMRNVLEAMTDPGKILELKDLNVQFKTYTTKAIEDIYSKIQNMEENIKLHNPDERIWTLNEEIPSLVEKVDISKKIDEFSGDAINALQALIEQLDRDAAFMKIIENYKNVEPLIARKLEEKGKITDMDLKVKYVEKFLLLYNLKNPHTTFKEKPLMLVKKG
ncbi:MAG: hypothetical protein V3V36_03740 [Candidatus Hydrothermarchaeaceae archaeon]